MTFRRQMNDPFRLVFVKQRINGCSINDIHALKHIVRCILDIAQVLEVPGIGQHVHIDDAVVAVFVYKQANDVRANKSGTAGDNYATLFQRYISLYLKYFSALTGTYYLSNPRVVSHMISTHQ